MNSTPLPVQRLILLMAWSLSTLIALLTPSAYFLLSHQYQRGELAARAELRSADISAIIHKNPTMWRYEEIRLSELIEPRPSLDERADAIQILDTRGEVLAKNHVPRPFPSISYTHSVYDAGAVAARIEFHRPLLPLLYRTLLVGIFSTLVALLVFRTLRTIPLRAIQDAYQALQRSEDQYRSLFETLKEGLALHRVTRNGTGDFVSLSLIELNPACVAMLGGDRDSLIGSDSVALFGEPFKAVLPELLQVEKGRGTRSFEVAYPDRGAIYLLQAFSPGPGSIATLFENITERRNAVEERLKLERKLLHAQKLESLGVLSGGIAHDFNNLLHALLGNLDLALMKFRGDEAVRRHLDQAVTAGKQAARLTDMILAYTGKKMFSVQKVNLTDLAGKNASLLAAVISRGIVFDLALDRDLPPVMADEGQMQQVIMNLITNASEAIGDQTGTIRLVTRVEAFDQPSLDASCVEEKLTAGSYVVLEVRDNGCGMDEATLHRLFDPFFTTKFTGRGLGMSAVLGIIRAHQGAFLIESSPGAGTTVRVLLPPARALQTAAPLTAPPSVDSAADGGQQPAQVLVVDDEEMVRQVVVAMLNELGVRTVTAANGEEALRVLHGDAQDRIDLVLLDQNMPLMDGATVFREMKKVRPDVKVLLASGFSEADIAERFKGLGLAGFIQKPYDIQGLSASLRRALRNGPEDRAAHRSRKAGI